MSSRWNRSIDGGHKVYPGEGSAMEKPEVRDADVDEKAVETAVKRAKALLAKESLGSAEVARVEAAIARSFAKLPFRRRRRHL